MPIRRRRPQQQRLDSPTIRSQHPQAKGLMLWVPYLDASPKSLFPSLKNAVVTTGTPTYGLQSPVSRYVTYGGAADHRWSHGLPAFFSPWSLHFVAKFNATLGLTCFWSLPGDNPYGAICYWWSSGNGLILQAGGTSADTSRATELANAPTGGVGQWHWYTFTWNGVDGTRMKIYVDGRDQSKNGSAGLTPPVGFGSVCVGSGYGSNFSNMSVAEFRLYRRELTPAEVWALYDPRTRWNLYEAPSPRALWYVSGGPPAGRTTRNSRSHPLGIRSGTALPMGQTVWG